jgi:molybdopterin-guanine dinucleotide biosynthesis protein A
VKLADVAGAVLTGGVSRRMGQDKACLEIGGLAGATRAALLLDPLVAELLLVGGSPPEDAPGRRVPDPPGESCALLGLVAALEAADAECVLVLATDLPLVTRDLLLALVAWPEAEAVVPRPASGPQPLCALYRREPVLRVARRRLAQERRALRGLVDELEVSFLDGDALAPFDPDGTLFTNVNTPAEAESARVLISAS